MQRMMYLRTAAASGLMWLMLTFSAGGGQAARAAEVDCAEIEDPGQRLACYDRRFRRPPAGPESQAAGTTGEEGEDVETAAQEAALPTPTEGTAADKAMSKPAATVPVAPPPPARAEEPALATERKASESEPERTFLGDEKVNLTSTIKAILAGEKQKMVFQLDNNQIWIQATPRPLPFKEGDRVTIKNALLGGYFMRSEKGVNTRVQRIH